MASGGNRLGKGWEREEATDQANLILGLWYEARSVGVEMTVSEGYGKSGLSKGKEQLTQ